ncbi:tetratricopeptide repeat-containing sensor histidine kinase [Hymenobacter arizonensis]|uniref:tetratricopeptide repeat-containing sensor histidine kinase n=1 Tax=Hymenobacter arizonensis TaxID=1227077 RepID=UPI000B80F7FD|nr:tetratricopeptide repeat protein [Hymenobacter arizonensis]
MTALSTLSTISRLLLVLWLLLAGVGQAARAQTAATDSLRRELAQTRPDSSRVLQLLKLAYSYRASKPDSTTHLARKALQLAQRVGFGKGEGQALGMIGGVQREQGQLPEAFATLLQSLPLNRQNRDFEGEARSLNSLGNISLDLRQYRQALRYYEQSKTLFERLQLQPWVAGALTNLGSCYEKLGVLDSALLFQQRAEQLIAQHPQPRLAAALALRNMGNVLARLGRHPEAFAYYRRAIRETYLNNDLRNRAMAAYLMADLHHTLQQPDSALRYAHEALRTAQKVSYRVTMLEASNLLTRLYQARANVDSAFRYQRLAMATHDSLFGPEKFQQLQLLAFTEQQKQLRQEQAQEHQTVRYQRLGLLAIACIIGAVALLLGRSNRQQRRANQLLNERNVQIDAQRQELAATLAELRSTQAQLVAAEKLAFIGELSAGIAHELRNPLAFMHNFAEVSVALIDQEQPGAAQAPGLEQEIRAGLKQNLQQISQHGQRASSIIKNMLDHARTGTSQREPTDLNALVAQTLLLTNHGSVAPGAGPAVELHTHFAPQLQPVPTVPGELGRALLNLFTNALQAARLRQAAEPGHQPVVSVTTERVGNAVEVRVRDNGPGMSDAVAAQAFKPFFTTKPVGEGTGLGLSLAHDIITKGHHGSLTLKTQEGEFTEFTVQIPA